MKTILFPAFLGLALFASFASGQTTVRLWPNDAPNAAGNEAQDTPTMTPFPALKETATGAAVLVCPGGGYTHLSDVKEGSDVAKWLNTLGISAFVLKYRVGPRYHQPTPMLDAARALRTVRAHAKDWQIDASQ